MANQGAKKRREENALHMKTLLRLIIVIYLVIRIGVFHSSFTWKHWEDLILTSVAYAIPYQQLAAMAKPAYSDDGDLLDGGFNMRTGGICGYLHGVIYITCFVQLRSIISEKFWHIYLVYFHCEGFTEDVDAVRLMEAFSQYGSVIEARAFIYPGPGTHKGYGYVTYDTMEADSIAIQEFNGKEIEGGKIRVTFATEEPHSGGGYGEGGGYGGGGSNYVGNDSQGGGYGRVGNQGGGSYSGGDENYGGDVSNGGGN